jgi:adenine-specific DNA-methyltransferase
MPSIALRPAPSQTPPLIEQPYPQFIKYMGSKTKIMGFVLEGVNEVFAGGAVCDLFAGSGSLAGAIGRQVPLHSNDIQAYSVPLAGTYLNAYRYIGMPSSDELLRRARELVDRHHKQLGLDIDYHTQLTLKQFNELEKLQQAVLERRFQRPWHLFVKYYSGTWWSATQCLWIDALRQVAEEHKEKPCYHLLLACLMHAMAYAGQGTGHYAQYRDAKTQSSMDDILIYRRRRIEDYFARKYDSVVKNLPATPTTLAHHITTLDYRECLKQFEGGTVYADPPYCFVHYSRFYHAIETLVKYDYPPIQVKAGEIVKGRYREDRHQSPFCIRSQVKGAFLELFQDVRNSGSNLVLSYSNTGMISIEEVNEIAREVFPDKKIDLLLTNHQHMTLGRQFDRHRDVEECLVLVR